MNHKTPPPELIDKEKQVFELRRSGANWVDIGKAVGYKDHTGAIRAYNRAMVRTLREPADQLRAMESERLDRLQRAYWISAIGDEINPPEIKAAELCLKIIDRRAKLFGLDAPIKAELEVTTYDGNLLRERTRQIIQAIRELPESQGALGGGTSESGAVTE